MATLQSSGTISLGNVQSVMGGSNPASMSEYYRGGTYVPSTKTVTPPMEGPFFSAQPPYYYWAVSSGVAEGPFPWEPIYYTYIIVQWNSTYMDFDGDEYTTSYTRGGYTYYRGSLSNGSYNVYQISRSSTTTTTTNINTSVPTSGTISLSNFYGAEKP